MCLGSLGNTALTASATPLPINASINLSGDRPVVEGSSVIASSAETPASVMSKVPPPSIMAAAMARATTIPI
jgi:hypothetical protein